MPTYAKAIVAAITTFLSQLTLVMVADETIGDLTQAEWSAILLATILATAAVWGVPNGDDPDPDSSTQGPYPNGPQMPSDV